LRQTKQAGGYSISSSLNIAKSPEDRYKAIGQRSSLDECVSLLSQNWDQKNLQFGHPKLFFNVATHPLVEICLEHALRNEFLPAYGLLFKALRKMLHLELMSTTRQKAVIECSTGYGCDAAACALANNDATTTIKLLE
jgi:hypothetical protein